MNHYEALEISKNSSQSEIKQAYRRLAKKFHPDINPSEEAKVRMRSINEAYEILSDVTSRSLYDLFLQGVPVKSVVEDVTPRQRYKAEYLRKRAREQRVRMEQQIHYKQLFYGYFRIVNAIAFIIALLLSYDYYFPSEIILFQPESVNEGRWSTYVHFRNRGKLETSKLFSADYERSLSEKVEITFSALLHIPKDIRASNSNVKFRIRGTFFAFNNVFPLLLFLFSIVVIGNKYYSDFRLTCGLVSCVILLWVVLVLIPYV